MSDALGEIEAAIGPPPRRVGLFKALSLRTKSPYWLPATDPLREVYRKQDLLLREGEVVWGVLVQANMLLFRDGLGDHPAMVIYSRDHALRADPNRLRAVGSRLYALKGTTPDDPDERRYAGVITDEMDRSLRVVVPRSLGGRPEVISTTVMVRRKHLPRGRLEQGWFPLLVHDETPATLILPSCFWPEGFVARWTDP